MKKLIGLGLLLVACRGSMTPSPAPQPVSGPGAATASAAVTAFLDGAKAGDIQAMSAVWGTAEGPARDQLSRTVVEERLTYVQRCLRHDKFTVLSDGPGLEGRRVFVISLTRGGLSRQAEFFTVPTPSGRWFFEKTDVGKLNDICIAR